jgi:Tol biopolymer transport system component
VRTVKLLALTALAFLGTARLSAQSYFGQNQVQFDQFDWKVLETEHFLIHYYPQERVAVLDAARMAERSYARLSRILDHQFREKKPMALFASRSDFGQNNVTGDLGEGTGGVTEAQRHRVLLPFTGDYKSFEHVLQHELVHAFQYDIFARGKAGAGLQNLAQVEPPLWFMEGMAEYLSLGPNHTITQVWLRDAAINGTLPTIEQMTLRPDRYFPYRYGEALWEYIGARWGDEVIGQIMNAVPNVGIERAFKRELGMSLDDLSDEWREAMQSKHLPQIATYERPRKFSQSLLTQRKSGGLSDLFLAPALSSDGKYIAFIAQGSFLRGEVFPDLWLGNGETGKRIKRLVKSVTNPEFEELRLLYSQSAFSPDARHLAFTAQRKGKDVLYILDVKRKKTVRRLDLPIEGALSPSWSPDGQRIVFSGNNGGITDLYMVDADGKNLRRLTDDRYGDLMPQWSPDGKAIAFATDRGEETSFELLRFNKWRIAILDLASGAVTVLPGQGGHNLNPMWGPDGRSIAFISDRSGTPNVFLYDLGNHQHYQLTNVIGGVLAFTEYSPGITWAREADRLAFTYFEKGDYTVWTVSNPRQLKKQPYREPQPTQPLIAAAADSTSAAPSVGSTPAPGGQVDDGRHLSYYRSPAGFRPSGTLPGVRERGAQKIVTVAQLLDSAELALPDTTRFKEYDYKVRFQPDYVARPSIGYAQDNFGQGVFGGTTIILSDMLGNNRLAFSGEVNGRISEARVYASYANLGRRFQYITGLFQEPYYFLSGEGYRDITPTVSEQTQVITRFIQREVFGFGLYPLNRFARFEVGARFSNIDQADWYISRGVDWANGYVTPFRGDSIINRASINYVAPHVAYVSDNALFGYTGPIYGHRMRFQVEPALGSVRFVEYLGDYRRYDPLLFNFLTVATRVMANVAVGPDELRFNPKYIGQAQYIRGYDRNNFLSSSCNIQVGTQYGCSATQLLGSRVALANAELRFPLVRRFELGILPIALPPLDGLVFYDIGLAWSRGQDVSLKRPADYDPQFKRYPLRSYGFGLRLNLFNFALVRWDYAIPLDAPSRKGFWVWTLGPSF